MGGFGEVEGVDGIDFEVEGARLSIDSLSSWSPNRLRLANGLSARTDCVPGGVYGISNRCWCCSTDFAQADLGGDSPGSTMVPTSL